MNHPPPSSLNDNSIQHRLENPYLKASFVSRLFFSWAYDSLLQVGLQRPLQEHDLPHVDIENTSSQCLALFQSFLSTSSSSSDTKNASSSSSSVQYKIIQYYLYTLRYTQVKIFLYIAAMVLQACALGQFLTYFSNSNSSVNQGILWATILILCSAIMILSTHSLYYDVWLMGMRLRISSVAILFDKTLKLFSSSSSIRLMMSDKREDSLNNKKSDTMNAKKNTTTTTNTMGQIVNLASNDSERFLLASIFGLYLMWGPIHAIIVFIIGCILLQSIVPFLIGYIVLFLFAIIQYYMSQQFVYYRSRIASKTDARIHKISQLLVGIRLLKLSTWEKVMTRQVQSIRQDEMSSIQYATILRAINEAIFFVSSSIICCIIFIAHFYTSRGDGRTPTKQLTLGTMYTIFALMNPLQFTMVKYFSTAVMACSECWVSVRRIVNFLSFSEISTSSTNFWKNSYQHEQQVHNNDSRSDTIVVSFHDAIVYWNHHQSSSPLPAEGASSSISSSFHDLSLTLMDESVPQKEEECFLGNNILALSSITLDICRGELCCIIGPVGCGKSALLQAIARELPLYSGTLNTSYQNVSYSAQDPWIMNATARENILLGKEFEKTWYDQVVISCGLDKDFTQFIHGDATIIGDRGVQISGGQRARISLARALYRDADLLLLDDPLSAVDSKTGRLIYEHAIIDIAINRGRTVVLATHQHQFIRDEKCIAMDHGKILMVGSYISCMERLKGIQGSMMMLSQSDVTSNAKTDSQLNGEVSDDFMDRKKIIQENFNHSVLVDGDSLMTREIKDNDVGSPDDDHKEYRQKGDVTLSTWRHYERALGGRLVSIGIILLMLLTQTSLILSVAMTASWVRQSQTQNAISRLKLAVLFCAILFLSSFLRSITFFRLAINASKRLHDDMTYAVLRATILFFDTNPIGRILNRFSSDVGTTDDALPDTLFDFLVTFTMVIGGIATAIFVLPPVLLSLPLLLILFLRSRKVFVCSSQEIKRLEGLSRSPIFDSIAESLNGVATIRANDAVPYFRAKFEDAQNAHSRAFFAFIYTSRYLGVRIDCLMFIVIFISCYLAIILKETDLFHIDSVTIGLALSMLLQMGEVAQWSTRQSAEVTNQMISVERLYQYSQLPSEALLETPADFLLGVAPSSWPSDGAIHVQNLCVRYRPSLPLSLINITFTIKPKSHVAICGRTGGGKSTLVQSFLRLLEAEDGKILIDGIDISTLGLHRLRQSITVINQVPTLYGCMTVRDNLDPMGVRSEEEIRQALIDVQMMETIDKMYGGLDAVVSEGGGNFSVGQRALLALARAILRRSKIVILDEPTANVDRETEFYIQEAIRKRFHDATMITVAHRLNTIIECDQVLVMGNGRLIEWGTPYQLLLQTNGAFASLVNETGIDMALQLRAKARSK